MTKFNIRDSRFAASIRIALTTLVLMLAVIQLKNNASWVYTVIEPGKFTSADEAWSRSGSRDYVAYAKFIKKNLLTSADNRVVIFVPPNDKSNNRFLKNFKVKAPNNYLFPSSVQVLDNYEFKLSPRQINRIEGGAVLSASYGANTFHTPSAVNPNIETEWAIFISEDADITHIYTLPLAAQDRGGDFK